jgi:hypothetical protein
MASSFDCAGIPPSCTQADCPALTEVRFLGRLSDFDREIRVEKLTDVRAQAVRSAQRFASALEAAKANSTSLRDNRIQDEHEQSIPHPGAFLGRRSLLPAPLAA